MTQISLQPVTEANFKQVERLFDSLQDGQDRFVARNVYSQAEAYVSDSAWPRAICDGDTPVGFIMLLDDPQKREYYLWRLMIGGPFQGRGFGRAVIELLVEHVRQRPGATRLTTSCVQGEGSPEGFYQRLSFVSDGQMYGEELDLALELPEIPTRAPEPPADLPEYAQINRDHWNRQAPEWAEWGRKDWDPEEPSWSIWRILNSQLPLPSEDMQGIAAIKLGCGTGYVSSWMHRRGAQVTGIDPTVNELPRRATCRWSTSSRSKRTAASNSTCPSVNGCVCSTARVLMCSIFTNCRRRSTGRRNASGFLLSGQNSIRRNRSGTCGSDSSC